MSKKKLNSETLNQKEESILGTQNTTQESGINNIYSVMTKEELINFLLAKKERKIKEEKIYSLTIGTMPEENKKPLGKHAEIIVHAIKDLISENINSATRAQIMEKAICLGLYEEKPSKQNTIAIFSWWRKDLKDHSWINY